MIYAQAIASIYLAFIAFKIDVPNTQSVIVFKLPLFITAVVMGFAAYGPIMAEWGR